MIKKINPGKNLTYSIGQVASHVNLPQSVLRYWETVFPLLNPVKSAGGSRQYSDADVTIVIRIKELLYEQGFTIKGANHQLQTDRESIPSDSLESPDKPDVHTAKYETLKSPQDLIQRLKKLIQILED